MGMESFQGGKKENLADSRPEMTLEEAKNFMEKVRGIDESLLPVDLLAMKDKAWEVISKTPEDTEDDVIADPFARGGDRMDSRPTLQ